ncbi:hypothetical protein MCEMAEM6B_00285 [Mycobacteriaceae bacterium]
MGQHTPALALHELGHVLVGLRVANPMMSRLAFGSTPVIDTARRVWPIPKRPRIFSGNRGEGVFPDFVATPRTV